MPRHFTVAATHKMYSSPWLTVMEYDITRDGKAGTYSVAERADAVMVVVEAPDGRYLFLKQYRFPIQAYIWEIPMGGVDAGESAREAAERELWEETGLKMQLEQRCKIHPIPGLSPQQATIFWGRARAADVEKALCFDKTVDEIVDRRWVSKAEIRAGILSGEFSNGFTLIALAAADLLG